MESSPARNRDDSIEESYRGTLHRRKHIEHLMYCLTNQLPKQFEKLVSSQTWAVYWISHSLALLEQTKFLETVTEDVIEFILECAHKDGGYGGGPGQIAHIATTFASINALITISGEEALASIDRLSLIKFLHRMKQPDGSFTMHDDGEVDTRATYCALAILRCLNIQDYILFDKVADWIIACQTYEGGFGSLPGAEAHGGYTFCSVASLCLLNQLHRADLPALIKWLTNKQMTDDGGFCGRSNKLVDSCYSYWQGAIFPLIHPYLKQGLFKKSESCDSIFPQTSSSDESRDSKNADKRVTRSKTRAGKQSNNAEKHCEKDRSNHDPNGEILNNWIYDCAALQDYVLNQCQSTKGLLRDKPGVPTDFYHTCYALSGLSISQWQPDDSMFDIGNKSINLLGPTHPLFNLSLDNLNYCFNYFKHKKIETYKEA